MSNPFDNDDGYGGDFGGSRSNDLSSRSGGGARSKAVDGGYRGREHGGGGRRSNDLTSRSGGGRRSNDLTSRSGGGARGDGGSEYGGGGVSICRGGGGRASGGYGELNDHETRIMMANKRMEESSAQSLKVLNETMRLGIDTTIELERQAESLDLTERRLDEMHQDLDKGERNLRKIKSPFGGLMNAFSRRKTVQEVTDPKISIPRKTKPAGSKSNSHPSKHCGQGVDTGHVVVDRNLDEMENALFQLKGIGELMGDQLDDSVIQFGRIEQKLERNDIKVGKLNKGIKKEL